MGRWQRGGEDDEISLEMEGTGDPRGSPLSVLVGVRRDGSPHARGEREGWIPAYRLCGGRLSDGGRGWGPRIREDNGRGRVPVFVFTGASSLRGTGMGPRIREDNGRGRVPVFVFTGASSLRGDGDGSPHPRGYGRGCVPAYRLHGGRL